MWNLKKFLQHCGNQQVQSYLEGLALDQYLSIPYFPYYQTKNAWILDFLCNSKWKEFKSIVRRSLTEVRVISIAQQKFIQKM